MTNNIKSLLAVIGTVRVIAADIENTLTNNICAIAVVESNDRMSAIGSRGERTAWQILPTTWNQYSKKGEVTSLRSDAYNVALRIYLHNHERYVKARGVLPNSLDHYAMWNLGFVGYRRRHFDINRCPLITRRAAMKYLSLTELYHERN